MLLWPGGLPVSYVPQHSNSMRKAKEGLRGEFALCIHSLGVGPRLPIRSARTHTTRQNREEGKEVVKTKQVGSREQKCLHCGIFSTWSAYDTRGSRLPTCKAPRPLPACRFRLLPPLLQSCESEHMCRMRSEQRFRMIFRMVRKDDVPVQFNASGLRPVPAWTDQR